MGLCAFQGEKGEEERCDFRPGGRISPLVAQSNSGHRPRSRELSPVARRPTVLERSISARIQNGRSPLVAQSNSGHRPGSRELSPVARRPTVLERSISTRIQNGRRPTALAPYPSPPRTHHPSPKPMTFTRVTTLTPKTHNVHPDLDRC